LSIKPRFRDEAAVPIPADLELREHGLQLVKPDPGYVSLHPDGSSLARHDPELNVPLGDHVVWRVRSRDCAAAAVAMAQGWRG
jgi:hypothetical protein